MTSYLPAAGTIGRGEKQGLVLLNMEGAVQWQEYMRLAGISYGAPRDASQAHERAEHRIACLSLFDLLMLRLPTACREARSSNGHHQRSFRETSSS